MRSNERLAERKLLGPIHFANLTALDQFALLARTGTIVDASSSGFLLRVPRTQLVPKVLKSNLTIDCLVGERVMLQISEMNLEIDGTVTRTKLMGKGVFEIAIDFSEDAPAYWRECLLDLLPNVGELE
jgi:hypothetical protein